MNLLRATLLRKLIVATIASTEVVVLVARPASWEIAAFTLAALLIVCRIGPRRQTNACSGKCDVAKASGLRLLRVRVSVRGMMIAVALVAIVLWPVHHWSQKPYYEEMARGHGLMAYFCANEAALMKQRAEACSARARTGAPWDETGEEAENLKCCPYPNDCPQNGSWSEQAGVWERAAEKARNASEWHSRMSNYCGGWSIINRVTRTNDG
jgi:hypothetical protein